MVTDAVSSRPLIGAVVALGAAGGERTTRSDETGGFVFARVTPGSYRLTVRRLGYQPERRMLEVVDGASPVAVALTRLTTLDTVRVRAAQQAIFGAVATAHDLRPLAKATVQVVGEGGGKRPVDATARFFIPVRNPGTYVVRAQAPGFEAQVMSVTVPRDEGVEVALLLDSATGPASNILPTAFFDFDRRLKMRRNASALIPRSELLRDGSVPLLGAIRSSPTMVAKGLVFGLLACVFVDGRARPGVSVGAFDTSEIEAIEAYVADPDGSLSGSWPKGFPCAETGMPRKSEPPSQSKVQWVVIWLKR